jgi:hypothetical protein
MNNNQLETGAVDAASTDTVTFAGGGMVFVNTYASSVSQAYKNCIAAAEADIASRWTNSITLHLTFNAQTAGTNNFLASNSFSLTPVSYAQLKSVLASHATSADGQTAVNSLPASSPQGGSWSLPEAYARMLGLNASTPATDDTVTLNTSYNWTYGQDVTSAIEHEISEGGMGRIGGLGDQGGIWSTMDLFRYNSSGARDYSDGRDGRTTYFSLDGHTLFTSYPFNNEYNSTGVKVNGGDTADFTVQDVFGTGSVGSNLSFSTVDLKIMAALGWTSNVYHCTPGNDQISVTGNNLFGFADDGNNDQIYFQGSQNQLFGGTGNDWLGVSGSNNALVGGSGNNWIGATGNGNTLVAGSGNSTLFASGGANVLYAGGGQCWEGTSGNQNQIFGGAGADWMGASGSNNAIAGGTGASTLYANGTSNTLSGGSGNDFIGVSGNGNNLYGGNGNCYLAATGSQNTFVPNGGGNDVLFAAANAHDHDTFVYHPGYGKDTIYNFVPQVGDVINIAGFGISTVQGFAPYVSTSADGSIMLNFSSSSHLTLEGIAGGLQNSWFNFHA